MRPVGAVLAMLWSGCADPTVETWPICRPGCSLDAGVVDAPGPCDPVLQTNCATGEKCAWIIDALSPYAGHVACAPDGTNLVGEMCRFGAPQGGGWDNCKQGLICGNYFGELSTCTPICDLTNGTASGCSQGMSCLASDGVLTRDGQYLAGACR
jgi:hypothetical protein